MNSSSIIEKKFQDNSEFVEKIMAKIESDVPNEIGIQNIKMDNCCETFLTHYLYTNTKRFLLTIFFPLTQAKRNFPTDSK